MLYENSLYFERAIRLTNDLYIELNSNEVITEDVLNTVLDKFNKTIKYFKMAGGIVAQLATDVYNFVKKNLVDKPIDKIVTTIKWAIKFIKLYVEELSTVENKEELQGMMAFLHNYKATYFFWKYIYVLMLMKWQIYYTYLAYRNYPFLPWYKKISPIGAIITYRGESPDVNRGKFMAFWFNILTDIKLLRKLFPKVAYYKLENLPKDTAKLFKDLYETVKSIDEKAPQIAEKIIKYLEKGAYRYVDKYGIEDYGDQDIVKLSPTFASKIEKDDEEIEENKIRFSVIK